MTKKHKSLLNQLHVLGGASKQLSKKKKHVKLARRCHIVMASIVSELWPHRKKVFKEHPELKELFEALMLLYLDCENGYADNYINEKQYGSPNGNE